MTVSVSYAREQGGRHLIPGQPSAFLRLCDSCPLCSQAQILREKDWVRPKGGGLAPELPVSCLIKSTSSGEELGLKPSLSSDC